MMFGPVVVFHLLNVADDLILGFTRPRETNPPESDGHPLR